MQVTIAKAIDWHFTVWLCVFGVLGLVPFATVRASKNLSVALANGRRFIGTISQPIVSLHLLTVRPSSSCSQTHK